MLHAVWIAVFALALVSMVRVIPLAGLLVVVGVQLVKLADTRTALRHGELALYLVTAVGVLALNLLEGVLIGLALAAVLVLRRAVRARVRHQPPEVDGTISEHRILVEGAATFLCVPKLARVLAGIPAGAPTRVDLAVDYLDHAVHDHLDTWVRRHRAGGASVVVTERRPARRVFGASRSVVLGTHEG